MIGCCVFVCRALLTGGKAAGFVDEPVLCPTVIGDGDPADGFEYIPELGLFRNSWEHCVGL